MKRQQEDVFTRFTSSVSKAMGHAWIFVVALLLLVLWALSGPALGFSDTWQLVINTSTTIITFLMVFIIQNTQNRDNSALNIKLDTLLKAAGISDKNLIEAEEKSDKNLEREKKSVQNGRNRKKASRG